MPAKVMYFTVVAAASGYTKSCHRCVIGDKVVKLILLVMGTVELFKNGRRENHAYEEDGRWEGGTNRENEIGMKEEEWEIRRRNSAGRKGGMQKGMEGESI